MGRLVCNNNINTHILKVIDYSVWIQNIIICPKPFFFLHIVYHLKPAVRRKEPISNMMRVIERNRDKTICQQNTTETF